MIKLTLPQYDPNELLVFRWRVFPTWGDDGQHGRGRHPEGRTDHYYTDEGMPMPSYWGPHVTMWNATNEFHSFPTNDYAVALNPDGSFTFDILVDGRTRGLDGTVGWFSIAASELELVDLEIFYTPVAEDGHREAQGRFV